MQKNWENILVSKEDCKRVEQRMENGFQEISKQFDLLRAKLINISNKLQSQKPSEFLK